MTNKNQNNTNPGQKPSQDSNLNSKGKNSPSDKDCKKCANQTTHKENVNKRTCA